MYIHYFKNQALKTLSKFGTIYKKFSVIALNVILLFILINLVCYWYLKKQEVNISKSWLISPGEMIQSNPNYMQKIHGQKSIDDINELYSSAPQFASHPTLFLMTTPVTTKYYKVGFENCRYDNTINANNVQSKMNNSIWLFGGSTMFGTAISSDETISAYLNKKDTTNSYINFGVIGYNQNNEINKLIILLKKGYRPKKVIFLDGLNDLIQLSLSNFSPQETPINLDIAYASIFNAEKLHTTQHMLLTLPIVQYLLKNKAKDIESSTNDINQLQSLYHQNSYLHFASTRKNRRKDLKVLDQKIESYYTSNIDLIDKLAKAYNFEYKIYFQPNGLLLENNKFVKSNAKLKSDFRIYPSIVYSFNYFKNRLKRKNIENCIDITDLHLDCKNPYVDIVHYSAELNEIIAKEILKD